MRTTLSSVIAGVVLAVAGLATAQSGVPKEHLSPESLSKPTGYTHVVTARGGKTVYVAGQVALDKDGNVVGKGDLRAQVQKVFDNLGAALRAAGATPADVVKTNIYVVNPRPDHLPVLREVRNAFFAGVKPPASTFIGVVALAREDFLVEIEAIAVVP